MNRMKQLAVAITTIGVSVAGLPAMAEGTGDFLVRFGPAVVMPNDDSGEVKPLSGTGVEVEDGTSLAFTLTYMYTDNVGFSVLGALPFEHDIKGDKGAIDGVDVGTIEHLPPTFTVDYYFQPGAEVRPYVGAGINFTIFSEEDADSELETLLGGDVDIELDDSTGLAVVAGVDVDINEDWFFNGALWYIDIETDADLDTPIGDLEVNVDIDPWVLMLGVGTSF